MYVTYLAYQTELPQKYVRIWYEHIAQGLVKKKMKACTTHVDTANVQKLAGWLREFLLT